MCILMPKYRHKSIQLTSTKYIVSKSSYIYLLDIAMSCSCLHNKIIYYNTKNESHQTSAHALGRVSGVASFTDVQLQ